MSSTSNASTQTTGAGLVLGVPDDYYRIFPGEVRLLAGKLSGVLLYQQTASNLHVAPGDEIQIQRFGLQPTAVRVDGVIDLPQIDSLFQKVGSPPGSQPQAPPDNVVLIPSSLWHQTFNELAVTRPDLVHEQFHVALNHRLPSDPAAAFNQISSRARNFEARVSGQALVGNNLGAALDAARKDALYSQVLFLFLGLPGALLAGLLTMSIVSIDRAKRRHDQALLRTRGASSKQLLVVAVVEALFVGILGASIGMAIGILVGKNVVHINTKELISHSIILPSAACFVSAIVIAVAAIVIPVWRNNREMTVNQSRRVLPTSVRKPLWSRLYLDFFALGFSALIFWITSRRGYQLVLVPEGLPTISVNYWALGGPVLLWIGGSLLIWRVVSAFMEHGRIIIRTISRPVARDLSPVVAASLRKQQGTVAKAVALMSLTVAFAISTSSFNATFKHQAKVDAILTNGADVTVTEPQSAAVDPTFAKQLLKVKGVRSVEPLQHRYAYVGPDLQDLFGVRTSSVVKAAQLQNAYFLGGSARDLIHKLAQEPNGILVSEETARDFQLHVGDQLTLRIQNAQMKQLRDVKFHFVGVVREFPTAPRDSFLVANSSYITSQTNSDAVGSFLIDTGGKDQHTVAERVRHLVGTQARVEDLATSRRVIGSSLTAVDLTGLSKIELGFGLVLLITTFGLMMVLGIQQRRRDYAIMSAVGASPAELDGVIWSEIAIVCSLSVIAGISLGLLLTRMLVKVLSGVFDPPPEGITLPLTYLGVAGIVAIVSVMASVLVLTRLLRRLGVNELKLSAA